MHTTHIEQQLTLLLRRVQRIHFSTSSGDVELDRSAYGILCRLVDEGPQRLGLLAQRSDWTRRRSPVRCRPSSRPGSSSADRPVRPTGVDPRPHRRTAARSSTTPGNASRLATGGAADWPEADLTDFGRLLEEFNASLDRLLEESILPADVDPGLGGGGEFVSSRA